MSNSRFFPRLYVRMGKLAPERWTVVDNISFQTALATCNMFDRIISAEFSMVEEAMLRNEAAPTWAKQDAKEV